MSYLIFYVRIKLELFTRYFILLLIFINFWYWEYKLIRSVFFVFKNAFISKWRNRSIKVLSLLTTFFHLSGNFRIPSRKNDSSLEASQFSISAKEVNRWLAASFGTTSNQKEQCPENMASAVKHSIWAFPNIFLWL